MLRSLWLRLSRRARLEQDLRDEVEFHLALKTEKLGDAHGAQRSFGNDTLIREDLRDAWSFRLAESVWQDIRHAVRAILRTPGFAIIAVLSLAIGVGANTAIFTVLHGLFLKSLPVKEPGRLRIINWTGEMTPATNVSGYGLQHQGLRTSSSFSWDALNTFASKDSAFESVGGFSDLRPNVVAGGRAQVVNTYIVSDGYFETLGTSAALGRTLGPSDNSSGAPHVAVVSWAFAERVFSDPQRSLGAPIAIDRTPYTIVGVLPRAYPGLFRSDPTDLYVPISKTEELSEYYRRSGPEYWWIQVVVRLKPDVTDEQARIWLDTALQRVTLSASEVLGKKFEAPKSVLRNGSQGLAFLDQNGRSFLLTLFAMVGVVLLITCANLGNLLLARGYARARELAVRQAMGARRGRIVRHLLTETLLIAVTGAALGFLLAQIGTVLLLRVVVLEPGADVQLQPDLTVLGFTLALTIATALLAGVLPAWRASSVEPVNSLRQSGSGGVRQGLARGLITVQIALALVLVASAGLFGRTLINLNRVPIGFRAENLLLFYVDAKRNGYTSDNLVRVYERIQQKVAAIPGVQAVTHSKAALLSGSSSRSSMSIAGKEAKVNVWVHVVGDNFLTIMGTPILSGRDLGPQEGLHSPRVVVVNEKLAQKFFDGHAVGRQLNDATIIGVAADVKYDRLRSEIPPTAYFPWRQQAERLAGVNFSIRTNVDPVSLVAAVRRAVAEIDSTLPVFNVRSQRQQIDMGIQRERTFAALAMFFSGVAVLLACIGIYGVLAYAVSRRTGEFGIRLALGATPGGISWLVVRGMLMPLIFAVAVGVPAALGAFSLFKAMLFGVNPDDPTTLTGAVAVIAFCAAVAALIPGRRAARCDPAIALRYD